MTYLVLADCNLGRMPVVTVDDSTNIGQSLAINYYIASELGMMVCDYNFL